MKMTLRAFLICFALILCLTPALMACDPAGVDAGNDVTNNESAGNDATNNENAGNDATNNETAGEDVTNDENAESDTVSVEGRRIATYTSMDKTHKVKMFQIEDTNGAEKVKCSLVLYTADDKIIDYVTFEVKVNGEDAKFECFRTAYWYDDKVEITVRDHDDQDTTYTLKYNK